MCINTKISQTTLKVAHWNIHGTKSKVIGNKLYDREFLQKILSCDIVGLSELHTSEEVSIPGFKLVKQKFRDKSHKGPKISGGLAVFTKNDLNHVVQVVPTSNEDSIWIKVKGNSLGGDLYIGTFYMSPTHNRNRQKDDLFTTLCEEVNFFKNKGTVLIQGDFNARTGMREDFISHDKFDEIFGIENHDKHKRNSEDVTVNQMGGELLDFCKTNDFSILNGRKLGDIFGQYTSHQWNGSSVVDYVITSTNDINNILSFYVGDFVPWLSDHCPLFTNIAINAQNSTEKHVEHMLNETEPGYFWKENSKEKFEAKLLSNAIKNKVEHLLNHDETEPTELAKEIKNILLNIATNCKLKRTKSKLKNKTRPWFDKECLDTKKQIGKLGKSLRQNPQNIEIRNELFYKKKALKHLVQKKKRHYNQSIIDELTSNRQNKRQKDFWKSLEKLNPDKKHKAPNISCHSLINHFKSTLNSKNTINIPPDSKEKGNLDHPFTMDELIKASKILKAGKSPGVDKLSNEILSCLISIYPLLALKLFNSILESNKVIPDWSIGLISPIHKKGPKDDPSNYRGISLLSCFGKLFMSLLNNRLMQYTLEKEILSKNQLGFLSGNRTSDAHIITHNLIRKYCHKYNTKLYSCFIDFSKAFDTIPRDILFQKLLNYGINGNFFNTIKNIYVNDRACIKWEDKVSETFKINQGVRQGCILSPLLFNIFLADLPKLLDSTGGYVKLGHTNLSCLIWADDILLFSENELGLTRMLKTLEEYCNDNKLTINTEKTKCMIFNKTGRTIRKKFFLNDTKLEIVRTYKYLGFLFTPSGEIKTGLNDLRDRALKAFMKLKGSMGSSFDRNIQTTLCLFDALVKPILLYASDFWGCLKPPNPNPVDTLHHRVCKQVLGVQKQTTNIGVLLELGRIPLHIHAIKAAVKNWERIRKQDANPLLYSSYTEAITEDLPWVSNIHKHLESNGMLCFYINTFNNKPPFIHKKIFQKLSDIFHQEAFLTISREDSKLRTYGLLKDKIGFEKYLLDVNNPKVRTTLAKFRLSNHSLMIEIGRFKKIPKEQRFCPFCINAIESEIHFLLKCPVYEPLREQLLQPITETKPNFVYYTDTEKFQHILSEELNETTPKFIQKCMDLRSLLINRPKRLT